MSNIGELELSVHGRRVTGSGLDAWLAEIGELMKLALPLAATQLAQMAVGLTDTLMLARFSNVALAGALLGNAIFFFAWILGCGPGAAVAPLIAHVLGTQPNARAGVRVIARMGMWSVILMSLPLVAIILCAYPIMQMLGQEPALALAVSRFVMPLCLGLPFSLAFQVLRNYSTALGKPNASLIVMVFTVAFNALGDYALIFGHFGFPRLGLTGSGTASACSYAFSFFVMLGVVALTPKLSRYRIFRRFGRPDWAKLMEIYRLGMPIGLTMMFEAGLFFSANFIMGAFGIAYAAAHAVAINVASITFMVPLGVAMGATVRVGLAAGAGDGAGVRRAGYSAMLVSFFLMACFAVVIATHTREIATLYLVQSAANAGVIALAVIFLRVAAAFQVFDGLQVAAALSLRGLKDAGTPMWLAVGSYWMVGFPVCLWLGVGLHMRGLGVWLGLALSLLVAATLMCARFWHLSRRFERLSTRLPQPETAIADLAPLGAPVVNG